MELYKGILEAPHTLIAGTTGSGKSVVLNGIIRELMENYTPEEKGFYLIDPKRVELSQYKNTAFCMGYTSEYSAALKVLDLAIIAIENRFKTMESMNVRQTTQGHVYIIIDELADLMISPAAKEIKLKLQKILQIGRAAGYHVIAATQAPNRKILAAEVVLNFTHRLALRCLSSIESRQIINVAGAEHLPKYGKGMFLSPDGISIENIPLTPDNSELIKKWEVITPAEIHIEKPAEIHIEKPLAIKPIKYDGPLFPQKPTKPAKPTIEERILNCIEPVLCGLFILGVSLYVLLH